VLWITVGCVHVIARCSGCMVKNGLRVRRTHPNVQRMRAVDNGWQRACHCSVQQVHGCMVKNALRARPNVCALRVDMRALWFSMLYPIDRRTVDECKPASHTRASKN
jgi:hypothetical protein